MLFWQRCPGNDGSTEPDVVLASNRWVIVVEVKLGSGFGESQPWREFQVGQGWHTSRGLSGPSHYVIVSRAKLSVAQSFDREVQSQQHLKELEPRTLYFRWLDAVALVDGWLRPQGEG